MIGVIAGAVLAALLFLAILFTFLRSDDDRGDL